MSSALFFKLLKEDDRALALGTAVLALRTGSSFPGVHTVEQDTFKMLSGAPLAYWVSDAVRSKFRDLPCLEGNSAAARVGLQTSDDFRFIRAWWEIAPNRIAHSRDDALQNKPWIHIAKGGDYNPFYSDLLLVVNWGGNGAEVRTFYGPHGRSLSRPQNTAYYFRPGLTWSSRTTSSLSVRVLPAGNIFAHKGPALFAPSDADLWALLGLVSSRPFEGLVGLSLGAADVAARSYEVGIIQRMPLPQTSPERLHRLRDLARTIHERKRSLECQIDNLHVFILPALLREGAPSLAKRLAAWNAAVGKARTEIEAAHREIDDICYRLYDISAEDRRAIEAELGTEVKGLPEPLSTEEEAAALVSWTIGVAMGRFDVRLATGNRPIPELPDPFAPLPAYSPGMLPEGKVPAGYPLRVAEDGILVDDEGHDWDIVARVRDVLHSVFGDRADAIEREAFEILRVASLRDYFTRLGARGFWDDHVKRYSKSRRRAPIYWLLRSPRGLYSAWVYYHRLDRDALHRLLGPRYLGSKIQRVRQAIEDLRPGVRTKPAITKMEERRLADLDDLLVDLEEFGAKIQAIVTRINDRGETVGYDPDLDDGVVLNAAPLHELIPWPKKRKYRGRSVSELAAYWEELAEGEYDWAQIAMRYWPTRVTEGCRADKSLALAHGLDDQFFPGLREEFRRQAETAGDTESQADEPTEDDVEEEDE